MNLHELLRRWQAHEPERIDYGFSCVAGVRFEPALAGSAV